MPLVGQTLPRTPHAGKIKAYIQLCLAISAQALTTKAASPTRPVTDNPKYTFYRPSLPFRQRWLRGINASVDTASRGASTRFTALPHRCWLLRLGFIGDEFETARTHLLANLPGNAAWRQAS